jgi:hypothetical protein
MAYTAVMVPATDFLTGVLSALVIYFVFRRSFGELPEPAQAPTLRVTTGAPQPA